MLTSISSCYTQSSIMTCGKIWSLMGFKAEIGPGQVQGTWENLAGQQKQL